MTATLERETTTREQAKPQQTRPPAPPTQMTVGKYLRWVLAAASLGAGGIHFAMISPHWNEWWAEGVFFSVLAWFQLAWAAGIVLRPSRLLFAAGALVNAAAVATWAVSRSSGVPFGPHAGVAEAASFVDILATALAGAILLGCLALLLRPDFELKVVGRLASLPVGIAGLGVVALTTMAFTPSFASGHTHGPAGHPAHGGSESAAAPGSGHSGAAHAGGSEDVVIQADGTSACEQSKVANDGNTGHGHRGPVPFTPMDDATRTAYAAQVAAANAAVAANLTVADAEAHGYKRVTPYVPCIAAHYLKGGALGNPFDPSEPEILLFEGTEPTSKIVGLSYLQFGEKGVAPDGFAGANDPWHVHSQLCIGGGGVLGDESTTEEQCKERGGRVIPLENLWMTHMWPVAGWESRWGLFSSEHPDLGGRIGDINGEPKPDDELNETNPNKKK